MITGTISISNTFLHTKTIECDYGDASDTLMECPSITTKPTLFNLKNWTIGRSYIHPYHRMKQTRWPNAVPPPHDCTSKSTENKSESEREWFHFPIFYS